MRIHVSLKVPDVESAARFYTALFGQEPTVLKADYAKWDVRDPAVNFVIRPSHMYEDEGKEVLGHLGIQVGSSKELTSLANRMSAMSRPFLGVKKTKCCYAKLEKAWVKGQADEAWELFLTHSHDEPEFGETSIHLLDNE